MAETDPTPAASPTPVAPAPVSVRALITLATIAIGVYAFDQLTKYLVVENLPLREPVEVLGTVLQFYFVENPGAAFSIATGYTWIFSIAAAAVTVFIIIFARRIRSMSWAILFGMLLGGTVGNLTDRLFREPSFGLGHVVDFIQVAGFPAIFNIADSFIVASMGLFIILTLRGVNLDGTRDVPRPTATAAASTPDDADDTATHGDSR
ncbi:signal peptidase II [Marisediminicola senii]|uniref:signal peptidase II n=1 Tax=Marisediminicola senii TaxID=2711233 RepID=UPI001F3C460F|nr:signal peptidase II [Marisediminicola senii]